MFHRSYKDHAPIDLTSGSHVYSNLNIYGDYGIKAEHSVTLKSVVLHRIRINTYSSPKAYGYGIYMGGGVPSLILDQVEMDVADNDDDFGMRANAGHLESNDCLYKNNGGKPCFRVWGLLGGFSHRDTFIGGEILCGGGGADQQVNQQPFAYFSFESSRVQTDSVEIMEVTHHVTFLNVNFTGTDHITHQDGSHTISYINCLKGNGTPLVPADATTGNLSFIRLDDNAGVPAIK